MKLSNAQRWLLAGAVLSGVVGLGIAWRAKQARLSAEAELAELRSQRVVQEQRQVRVRAERAAIVAEETESRAVRQPTTAPALAQTPKHAGVEKVGEFSGRLKEAAEDPHVQNTDARMQREFWRSGLRDFFRTMRFTPQQVERFLDIEMRRYARSLDVETVGRARSLARDDAAVVALNAEIGKSHSAEMRAEFGDGMNERLMTFRETNWSRNIAAGFGGMATMAGMPIDAAQGEQLLAAIVAATERNTLGRIETPCRIDWRVVDQQAKQILSAEQWNLFRTTEAPGHHGGGTRFVTELNDVLLQAARQEEAAARQRPGG